MTELDDVKEFYKNRENHKISSLKELIKKLHFYENHDYGVLRICKNDGTGNVISEDEYEEVLFTIKQNSEIVNSLIERIPNQTKVINELRRCMNNIEKSEIVRLELQSALTELKRTQEILQKIMKKK